MRLLLDTHVALWAVAGDARLSPAAKRSLTARSAQVFVSAVSLWEIAIKHALARGDMPIDADSAAHEFSAAGFLELDVTWAHTQRVGKLAPLHQDPFDRLLVAQAFEEPMTLVTHDTRVAAYSASFLKV